MKKPPTTAATSAAENRWMLDTNIISHAIRNPHGSLALRLQRMDLADPQSLCTSLVVQCELVFGATKADSGQLAAKIATMLKFIRPMPMDASLIAHYATIRTHLERQGTPIGPNDTLIAAHALALDCTLVTDNDTEFNRVPGLRVENWLREATALPSL